MADNKFLADYGKRKANCKKCKTVIEKGELRLAKITASPFSEDGEMKLYFKPACLFETFKRARATTKVIEEPGDIQGFNELKEDDKDVIRGLIKESQKVKGAESGNKGKKKAPAMPKVPSQPAAVSPAKATATKSDQKPARGGISGHKDNSFRQFRQVCIDVADEPSYNEKTAIMERFFSKGTDGQAFHGDLYVWVRLLLPGVAGRIYNLQSKQLIKIFARLFSAAEEDMLEDLEAGDVAETVATFFESSKNVKPSGKSKLSLHDVDDFLDDMTRLTREDDQLDALKKIVPKCTVNDLRMLVRLIKKDLRIQAGNKHVMDALHKDAYDAFNNSRNYVKVIDKVVQLRENGESSSGSLDVGASLMHPVQPMLALACKSVDEAFKRCPNGMYAEIKYDGERVQLHKKGDDFKFFSRSLKEVLPHKV